MKKILYILISVILAASCDSFGTRSPETPSGQESGLKPATTIEVFKSNLETSFNSKDLNIYLSLFPSENDSINYEFIQSNNSLTEFGIVFQNWDVDKEKRFFNNFITGINKNEKSLLKISLDNQVDYPDYTFLGVNYSGTFYFTNTQGAKILEGSSQFDLIKDSKGVWKIKRWSDFSKSNVDSIINFSKLKGKYSN